MLFISMQYFVRRSSLHPTPIGRLRTVTFDKHLFCFLPVHVGLAPMKDRRVPILLVLL